MTDCDDREETYTIRQMADRFHMEPSTLRYYEDQGLLPNVGRTATGQRVYRREHVDRLGSICCFKDAGMTIDELKRFFTYEADEAGHIDEMMALLEHRREAIEEQRRALDAAYDHVLRKLDFYGDVRTSIREHEPRPDWGIYARRRYVQ
ncbi:MULTISPECIES: MerR family transcriptional regulator [Bifidobacterium]|uniref:MerR family transcriptional regulator n=1 Tax=Bifidobacterium TaxID=1678 RepID=UPI001BDC9F19|nr:MULTISPECIES: MerR family transcriptional regulator [Bifidobacterium]MBT1162653.1 MerR family transcriptional regulator [Bifidobacterium sp. SO1]MBW3077940.1 MerR family transcriptional regulator [Bifidobacterium simiiventris]